MLSQKLCIILVHASLQRIYHMINAVQVMKGTCYGW